jgi:hypothetical protein
MADFAFDAIAKPFEEVFDRRIERGFQECLRRESAMNAATDSNAISSQSR